MCLRFYKRFCFRLISNSITQKFSFFRNSPTSRMPIKILFGGSMFCKNLQRWKQNIERRASGRRGIRKLFIASGWSFVWLRLTRSLFLQNKKVNYEKWWSVISHRNAASSEPGTPPKTKKNIPVSFTSVDFTYIDGKSLLGFAKKVRNSCHQHLYNETTWRHLLQVFNTSVTITSLRFKIFSFKQRKFISQRRLSTREILAPCQP